MLKKTSRTTVSRKPKRSSYEVGKFEQIVRESRVGHLAFEYDGSIHSIPMLCWVYDGYLYFHASKGGRMAKLTHSNSVICISFSVLDGLVLAKSAVHHSVNYRSAVIYGRCKAVEDRLEILNAMHALMNTIDHNRWDCVRRPDENELNAVMLIKIPIVEAVIKQRTGPAEDKQKDLEINTWSGVVPVIHSYGAPIPDQYCNADNVPEVK